MLLDTFDLNIKIRYICQKKLHVPEIRLKAGGCAMNPEQAEILRTAREKLQSGEDDLILEAINALAETNLDESSELVISCLDSTNEKIRLSAVQALGILKPENTVELLTALLQKESSPFVRATAAIALGNTKKWNPCPPWPVCSGTKMPVSEQTRLKE